MSRSLRITSAVLSAGLALLARPVEAQTATAGQLLISEFRLRGPSGANDEFIEIYNNTGAAHTVMAASGTGYGVAASDGVTRCTIPNGTVIPAGGHYLCANSLGYSLSAYASGNATYTTDIGDNAGLALFDNNTAGASYSLAARLDAVGSNAEINPLYKESTGYPALTPASIEYSWVRDECGKGAVDAPGPCTISTPRDTDNNVVDFYYVDTSGTTTGDGPRLGAAGPQNLSSPVQRNADFSVYLIDATVASSAEPNRGRYAAGSSPHDAPFGTLVIRRRFVNHTGAPITKLRVRVIDITTYPACPGVADLRARSTFFGLFLEGINDTATCAATSEAPPTAPCGTTIIGTRSDEPPSHSKSGAFNSSLTAWMVAARSPSLADGASLNLEFMFGVYQTGNFRFYLNVEAMR